MTTGARHRLLATAEDLFYRDGWWRKTFDAYVTRQVTGNRHAAAIGRRVARRLIDDQLA